MLRKIAIRLILITGAIFFQCTVFAFTLTSPAFANGGSIPTMYTCDGKDTSPAFKWDDAPSTTKSFVLIMSDVDAPGGVWDHWLVFNIPPQVRELNGATLPAGTLIGKNNWNRTIYKGPCPPDREHRYFFKLYALDNTLSLTSGASKQQLEAAMKGHILATAELMGKYLRSH